MSMLAVCSALVFLLFDAVAASSSSSRSSWRDDLVVSGGFAVAREKAHAVAAPANAVAVKPKVAIVAETSDPPALETWLRYHKKYVGVVRFFLCFEDFPAWVEELLKQPEWRGLVQRVASDASSRDGGNFQALQERQETCVNSALAMARQQGLDWLLHIDDDELLHMPRGTDLPSLLAKVPPEYGAIHFQNVEAVVPQGKDPTNCFLEATEFRTDKFSFVAYTNGKSAARVAASYGSYEHGPHEFGTTAPKGALDTTQGWHSRSTNADAWQWPVVLHFESCPFTRWVRKFWLARKTLKVMLKMVPFPFYRDSTTLVANCAKQEDRCDVGGLRSFFLKWKAGGPKEHLWQVHLPWREILGGDSALTPALQEDPLLFDRSAKAKSNQSSTSAEVYPGLGVYHEPSTEERFAQFWSVLRRRL